MMYSDPPKPRRYVVRLLSMRSELPDEYIRKDISTSRSPSDPFTEEQAMLVRELAISRYPNRFVYLSSYDFPPLQQRSS
jgi:nitrate reductase beta subunit